MVVTWPRLPGLAFYGKSAGDKATGFKVLSLPVLWEGLNTEWGVIASMLLDTHAHTHGTAKRISSSLLAALSVSPLPAPSLPPSSVWLDLVECHHCDFGGFLFPCHCLMHACLGYLLNLSRKWTVICSLPPMLGRDKCPTLVKIRQTGTSALACHSGLLAPPPSWCWGLSFALWPSPLHTVVCL